MSTVVRRRVVNAAPVKSMHRVWRKGRPDKEYWYVDAYTKELAIAYIARQFREPISSFDGK